MANLAASAITRNAQWVEGGTASKKQRVMDVTLVLTGQGDATDKILASTFDLTAFTQAHSFRGDGGEFYLATPSYDGSHLLLANPAVAANTAATFTDTIRGIVKGY